MLRVEKRCDTGIEMGWAVRAAVRVVTTPTTLPRRLAERDSPKVRARGAMGTSRAVPGSGAAVKASGSGKRNVSIGG